MRLIFALPLYVGGLRLKFVSESAQRFHDGIVSVDNEIGQAPTPGRLFSKAIFR